MNRLWMNEPQILPISYKWATKKINCTLHGILNGCGGVCCTGNFYPARANGGKCIYLDETGCRLSEQERPVKCLLYPFVIKNNRLVLYGRALMQSCKAYYKPGDESVQSIFKNMRTNFTALFGNEQYERVYRDITNTKNSYFILPDWWDKQVHTEARREVLNINPKIRKYGSSDF